MNWDRVTVGSNHISSLLKYSWSDDPRVITFSSWWTLLPLPSSSPNIFRYPKYNPEEALKPEPAPRSN